MQKSKIKLGKYWKLGIYVVPAILIMSGILFAAKISAEQNGSSPESGSTSRIKATYDSLVTLTHGSESSGSWGDWGSMWNRIRSAGEWVPDGTATAADVLPGKTFYSGNSRMVKTGAAITANYAGQAGIYYTSDTVTYSGWAITASGGTAASVTDNSITKALTSNKVYKDPVTNSYWTDVSAATMDNEYATISNDDRINPTGASCNFQSTETANAYCDNQDPTGNYTEDNDVSAVEFCLNLQLDADNLDGDNNGLTGVETDWHLPSYRQLMQLFLDGGRENVTSVTNLWSITEPSGYRYMSMFVDFASGTVTANGGTKSNNFNVRCIR